MSNFFQVLITLLLVSFDSGRSSQLREDFYKVTCPRLQEIVRKVVSKAIHSEMRMAASLLRLHYLDCFVNGCDGSILLDGPDSEKLALPNANSARGFEVIEEVKTAVEAVCENVVSCADILAIAARDSALLSGAGKWKVLLGRRDGLVANKTGANFLPSPSDSLDTIIEKFVAVGLNTTDAVALSGAHTIGRSRCSQFSNRLYNFAGTGKPDPTLDRDLNDELRGECRDENNLVALDDRSEDLFDNHYFENLVNNRGILQSDQELFSGPGATKATTKSTVELYSNKPSIFSSDFTTSMIKMGNIGVRTENEGRIRKDCKVAK